MATKIFIIGRNRSGTKWISNLIAENAEVTAFQRKRAYGLIESNLFTVFPRLLKGIRYEENYSAFKILFAETNFFKLSGLSKEEVFSKRYYDFYNFTGDFLEKYASSKGAGYIVQKADSIVVPELIKNFPDAKIIIIQRKIVKNNILSNILLNNDKVKFIKVLQHSFSYWHHRKLENRFKNNTNVKTVTFENLKRNKEEVLQSVCNFIGIDYESTMLKTKFKKNTSYSKKKRSDFKTRKITSMIYSISFLARIIPYWMYELSYKIKILLNNSSTKESKIFLPLTFQIFEEEKKQ